MSLDHDAAVKDLDAVLAALVDIKPMADYGVVGSYDTVQARRQRALAKAEQSLLALRAKLIDADGVEASQPLAYYDPIRDRVVTAAQMDSMLNHQGAPGKTAAKDYTVPLHASGVDAAPNAVDGGM